MNCELLLIPVSYLLGSIPTGYLLARRKGIDLRQVGSGNIGATNVTRVLGRRLGVLTFLGDMLKGLLPVLMARSLSVSSLLLGAVGLSAFLGHCYPIFLRFRGGKGVATGFGVCLGMAPLPALLALLIWTLTFAVTRISSLSSLTAGVATPILIFSLNNSRILGFILILVAILCFNHRDNIQRLLRGTEPRFKQGVKKAPWKVKCKLKSIKPQINTDAHGLE